MPNTLRADGRERIGGAYLTRANHLRKVRKQRPVIVAIGAELIDDASVQGRGNKAVSV